MTKKEKEQTAEAGEEVVNIKINMKKIRSYFYDNLDYICQSFLTKVIKEEIEVKQNFMTLQELSKSNQMLILVNDEDEKPTQLPEKPKDGSQAPGEPSAGVKGSNEPPDPAGAPKTAN